MDKNNIGLFLKVITLPFTEYELNDVEFCEINCLKDDYEKFGFKYNDGNKEKLYKLIRKTQVFKSIDEVNLLLKHFYYNKIPCDNNLEYSIPKPKENKKDATVLEYTKFYIGLLDKLSKNFISHRDDQFILKYWREPKNEPMNMIEEASFLGPYDGVYKVLLWNSLNRMFTTDILVMNYLLLCEDKIENFNALYNYGCSSMVHVTDPILEKVFEKGLAETHLHANAGIDFSIIWLDLMRMSRKEYLRSETSMNKFESHFKMLSKINFSDIKKVVLKIAILRIVMSKFLVFNFFDENNSCNFCKFIKENIVKYNEIVFSLLKDTDKEDNLSFDYLYDIFENLTRDLKHKSDLYNMNWKCKLLLTDYVYQIFLEINNNLDINGEDLLLIYSLKYMKKLKKEKSDNNFCKLFWTYLRIKNEILYVKVQSNKIKGLDSFQKYYDSSTELSFDNEFRNVSILYSQMKNKYLRKIELRIHPGIPGSAKNYDSIIRKKIRSLLTAYLEFLKDHCVNKKVARIGIIVHFIKVLDEEYRKKCNSFIQTFFYEPQYVYYGEIQKCYMEQLESILKMRNQITNLDKYILAIDTAGIENNTEPWIFSPVFKNAKKEQEKLYKSNGCIIKNDIGFTYHEGEDFRHIISGLRKIDELITHLGFKSGDRIGHGIVLGINPEEWAKKNRISILTKIEHLENMLWVWGTFKFNKYEYGVNLGFIENSILRLAEYIFGKIDGLTIYKLYKNYQYKFIENNSKEMERDLKDIFKYNDNFDWNVEHLKFARNCNVFLKRMNESIMIENKNEFLGIFSFMQKLVRKRISENGIVIETNPSSNSMVGDVENVFEHYISNINKNGLLSDSKVEDKIIASINSDDSSVFNTIVSNEFGYIYYSLVEKGYAREDIIEWIKKIRKNGMKSSFIKDRKISVKDIASEIEDILKYL